MQSILDFVHFCGKLNTFIMRFCWHCGQCGLKTVKFRTMDYRGFLVKSGERNVIMDEINDKIANLQALIAFRICDFPKTVRSLYEKINSHLNALIANECKAREEKILELNEQRRKKWNVFLRVFYKKASWKFRQQGHTETTFDLISVFWITFQH